MTITPTGSPAWVGNATAGIYGGHADKADYQGQGVINPKTDVSAAQFARLCADVAANSRVAPFGLLVVTCNDTVPAAPTVTYARQMSSSETASYEGDSPPSGFPTCARISDGSFQFTWPSSHADEFGVSANFTVTFVRAHVLNASGFANVAISNLGVNNWAFDALDDTAAAIPDAQITVEVG